MSDEGVHPWGDLPLPERFLEEAVNRFSGLFGSLQLTAEQGEAIGQMAAWAYRLGYGDGRDDEAAGLSLKDVTAYVHVDDEGKSIWFRPSDIWLVKQRVPCKRCGNGTDMPNSLCLDCARR